MDKLPCWLVVHESPEIVGISDGKMRGNRHELVHASCRPGGLDYSCSSELRGRCVWEGEVGAAAAMYKSPSADCGVGWMYRQLMMATVGKLHVNRFTATSSRTGLFRYLTVRQRP
jgi:hypothetical protein